VNDSQFRAARRAIEVEKAQKAAAGGLPVYAEVILHFKQPIVGPHSPEPVACVTHRGAAYVMSAVGNHAAVVVQEQGEEGTHHLYKWDDVVRIEAIPSRLTPPLAS